MRRFLVILLLVANSLAAFAFTKDERRDLLDAIRPEATRRAGQPVRFLVDRLNRKGEWALIVGELIAAEGSTMDWNKAKDCDPTLDKMLWIVAKKEKTGWKAKEMFICSPEPPYWYLVPQEAFTRPCGIYAGLEISSVTNSGVYDSTTVEQQCNAYMSSKRRALR